MKPKDRKPERLAEALGASRVVKLDQQGSGPLGWLNLAQTLKERFVSTGGRPSDPEWDTKRLVPFRSKTWQRLSKQARVMSAHGRKVGPAQLAAIIIEKQLQSGIGHQPNV